ncbi:MAG: hypothetical protein RIE08_09845 [Acidimicrobiales bacterium]
MSTTAATTTKRRIRSVPLVFGVLFVALGYVGIIAASDVDDAGVWMWPAALVAVGVAGLFTTVRTAIIRRRRERGPTVGGDVDVSIGDNPSGDDPEDADGPPDDWT